jgi:hypothetical protein
MNGRKLSSVLGIHTPVSSSTPVYLHSISLTGFSATTDGCKTVMGEDIAFETESGTFYDDVHCTLAPLGLGLGSCYNHESGYEHTLNQHLCRSMPDFGHFLNNKDLLGQCLPM